MTRLALRKIFEDGGCDVNEAEDGARGLELASAGRYDVVSTDVIMPRMDGYELTRRLRGLQQYQNVPIIMITSKSAEVDRRAGFDAGVDHYVAKPFERRQILDLLKEVLG